MRDLPARLRLVILDLDGVVYRGSEPVEGAVALVARLRRAGAHVRFATNNSMVARDGYVERLTGMGIPVGIDDVATSASATAAYLRRHAPAVERVMSVGGPGLPQELRAAGFEVAAAADAVPKDYRGEDLDAPFDAVVVGLDPSFDYLRLAAAVAAVRAGASFIATNADRSYPTARGVLPGAAGMVSAIAGVVGVEPRIIGKPQPAMFAAILEGAAVPPEEAVVIGDNPDSDMVAANRAGIGSVLVLTGVFSARTVERLRGEQCPSAVAAGPREVEALLAPRVSR